MARRRRTSRLYYREGRGWYSDFRDFRDIGGEFGGKMKAMIPPGGRHATHDESTAQRLMLTHLGELEERRRHRQGGGDPQLRPYASMILQRETEHGLKESTVRRKRDSLRNVLDFFGADVRLSEIDVARVYEYVTWRSGQPGRKGTPISAWTIHNELNALSSIYRWAVSERAARQNPVSMMPRRPRRPSLEQAYLEEDEAARLLAAAATLDAGAAESGRAGQVTFLHAIVATFLLTGGRKKEILGLLQADIHEGRCVRIRPNRFRSLKRERHARSVPLWPQLGDTLSSYREGLTAAGVEPRPNGLLFPSPKTGRMLTDLRGPIGRALELAEIDKHITLHSLRHSYVASRLQTLSNGAPVAPYTVAKELGHRGTEQIEQTYGHLLDNPRRREVVAYTPGS